MAKNDFISDNLVHMRERLKENAARAGVSAPAASGEEKPGREPASPPLLNRDSPRPPATPRTDGFDRQRRDFGCRLERDRASIAAELELESQKTAELERFAKTLEELENDFRRLPPGETPEIQREFEKVRFAFYRAAGRVAAFQKGEAGSPASPEHEVSRRGTAVWIPIAAAMIVAALIVSLTLIVLFH